MMRQRTRLLPVLLFLLLGMLSVAADAAVLHGQVRDTTSGAGIPSLAVKLIPPRKAGRTVKITTTNQRGDFVFEAVTPGRYLLEIYQGTSLLYREVLELTKDLDKQINLERSSH